LPPAAVCASTRAVLNAAAAIETAATRANDRFNIEDIRFPPYQA
jgi:hypothetical protein